MVLTVEVALLLLDIHKSCSLLVLWSTVQHIHLPCKYQCQDEELHASPLLQMPPPVSPSPRIIWSHTQNRFSHSRQSHSMGVL